MVCRYPSRERGLKCACDALLDLAANVAPFAGAWIEILLKRKGVIIALVAPFAGAWIEIRLMQTTLHTGLRRSLRGSVD